MCITRREISGEPDYVNEQELHLLYIWLQSNKLTLNVQKTYYIIFHRARLKLHNTTIDLQMGDCNLNKANNLKYLGLIIDDTMSWVHHITYIKKYDLQGYWHHV